MLKILSVVTPKEEKTQLYETFVHDGFRSCLVVDEKAHWQTDLAPDGTGSLYVFFSLC